MISVILAGGENRRFPSLKGFIEVGGATIIERTLDILRQTSEKTFICTNEPERYFSLGVPLIGDVVKSSGPLGGIVSAFTATDSEEILVTACDMPFIKPELIQYIIEKKGLQATVPVFNGRPEPLLAVYSRSALQTMVGELMKGQRSLTAMLGRLDVLYLEETWIRKIDPEGKSFFNINTPEDFEKAFSGKPKAPVQARRHQRKEV